jgi:hypothetical protein
MFRFGLILCTLFLQINRGWADFAHTEIYKIEEMLDHAKEGTLFVLDIDNTLIEPCQHLGSDQWFEHHLTLLKEQGTEHEEAVRQIFPIYTEVQKRTQVRHVDATVKKAFITMKEKGFSAMGLTKRDPSLADQTLKQLSSVEIHFHLLAPSHTQKTGKELENCLYQDGVVFTALGIGKGDPLLSYLKHLKEMPKHIVVVDDKRSNLEHIAKALKTLDIPFVTLRYAGVDEHVTSFDPKIATLQLNHLQTILSDEQAQHLLNQKENL